ncbi:tRNA-specific adenosine deaminase 1 [Coccinella septempunctata]|uniref:tRNA-specific adenosine deaminase 1 n=1 Tax=Coccinella septempunctata TaxID=41139 RepID=UPI001D0851ED|nr:tRNA-specific adenosine deaminase 1 [Coccinella septempunctata]
MGDSHFPETIAKICLGKFSSLPRSGKPASNQWTVLSCIIQEESSRFEVVALATGSKCIGSNKMSPIGDILNDSHAEVICRRAFMLYLYEELERALLNQTSLIEFKPELLKFQLNEEVKFHFFTTMMPCGDASIFPKSDNNNTGDVFKKETSNVDKKRSMNFNESLPKKLKMNDGDIHRTGAKCLKNDERQDPKGEGADYHITGVVRTKPGRGDPTLSISCSDKITKWCYLGLQGGLLSKFLEKPIYLSAFVVVGDTPFSKESLQRALFDRIGNIELAPPFGKKSLLFFQAKDATFTFQKADNKDVCPSSIMWYKNGASQKPEVAIEGKKQGVTKKNQGLKSSRLKVCKSELLGRFKLLHQKVHTNIDTWSYSECKQNMLDYQLNWKTLKSRLGMWPEKNEALLKFT